MNHTQRVSAPVEPAPAEAVRDKPAAGFDAVFEPYFEGLRQGRLRVQWCSACRRHQWPARSVCTGCLGSDLDWADVEEPAGTVFSWTVVHHAKGTPFASAAPYAVALVELEEQRVRMFAHVPEHVELTIGGRVAIDFENETVTGYPTWRVVDKTEYG